MHYPKPCYRKDRQSWYVDYPGDDGRTHRETLARGPKAETEPAAWAAYNRFRAARGGAVAPVELTVAMACNLFLDDAKGRVQANTFEQYRIKLLDFNRAHGKLKLSALRAKHVEAWSRSHAWSDSTRRGAITAVKVMLRWCEGEGHLEEDPAKGIKRPKMGRRERTIDPAERRAIREAAGPELTRVLDALGWTGCRPGEILRLEARHLDFEAAYAALPGKTTGATGDLVEFPLVPPMLALCRELAAANPRGPLFRNTRGAPWTYNALRCAVRRLRARLKLEGISAYTYRHSFATDALERGLPITDVAALMNHKDIRTTMGYNHLKERREHLRQQAEKLAGE